MKKRAIARTVCSTVLIMALAGCGGGGGGGSLPEGSSATSHPTPGVNSVTVTEDSYGLQNPTYLTSNHGDGIFVMRAAIASADTDPNFRTLFRIDVFSPAAIDRNGTYRIGDGGSGLPGFPGEILFFNGHQSTLLCTVEGTVTFTDFGTNTGDLIAGNFVVSVADGYSAITPQPLYSVKASFSFTLDSSGPVVPMMSPIPAGSLTCYTTKCSSCHALGTLDPVAESAPELSLKGGLIEGMFTAGVTGHQGIKLTASEISDMKVLLNAQ